MACLNQGHLSVGKKHLSSAGEKQCFTKNLVPHSSLTYLQDLAPSFVDFVHSDPVLDHLPSEWREEVSLLHCHILVPSGGYLSESREIQHRNISLSNLNKKENNIM